MAAAELFADFLKRAAINRGVASLQKRIGQYYSDSDDDNTNQFASNQRQGLGSILGRTAAYGLLGPILGPIAFALGSGIMSRRNRMSLTDDSIITPGPTKTGGGDPNQIQMQEPTTSQGQAIDPADLRSLTDDSGQDTGFSEYTDAGTAASYEGSFRYGGIASLYR